MRRFNICLPAIAILAIGVAGCSSPQSDDDAPDTILYNGNVITVDASFSTAQAVAIRGDRISAVGSNDVVRGLAGAATSQIDLAGRTVVPGLMDNHLHSIGGGPGVDLSDTRTLAEVLAAIGARADESPPGTLVVTNSDWHEAQLLEQRLPLRNDLDAVAPDNPVVVVRGGHEYILNSAALQHWGIDESTEVPPGGEISRYADGTLNGELIDRAKDYVTLPPPPERSFEERIEAQIAEYRQLHAVGLTGVRHPGGSAGQYRVIQELQRRGDLTMRVTFLLRFRGSEDIAESIAETGLQPDEGDEWLKIGGVKLGVDGGFEGGWMRDPYVEPWGRQGTFHGINTIPAEAFTATVQTLNELDWRVATHAVGDAAIDLVLDGYEAAHADQPITGKRWAIEHGFITAADQFPRLRALGLAVSAQHHLYVAGPSLEKYWGRERAGATTPIRTYLDENIPVSGGTDSPVIPYPPLSVIYHFVTRDTLSGGVFGPDQAVSREEALRLVTINNAYLTFEEDLKGSIEPGKLADVVVLSDDLMSVAEDRIDDLAVLMTMVGGNIVYEHADFR